MKIMWMSNAPWCGTGYGVQAAKVIPFLKECEGVEEVSLFCFYGIQGGITRQLIGRHWITCYPVGTHPYGMDMVKNWVDHAEADVVITLVDIFVTDPNFGTQGFYWLPYAPVDFDPLPNLFAERFKTSYRPIVYSKFAIEKLKEAGLECWYAPHGVDTAIFKPRPRNKEKDREWIGLKTDGFSVGMVAANKDPSDRKGFNEAFLSFRNLLDKHPNCELYVHAISTPEMGGLDLISLARTYGILDKTRFTLRQHFFGGLCQEDLARIYNTFDVFLNPCHRAGFEIPLIEAQAVGVPIIAGDWHSMTELCGSGWLAQPAQKQATSMESFTFLPSVASVTDCLLDAYDHKGDKTYGVAARAFA
ncbi:hypothetical protein LCGC14_2648510, partial [marine sediment metagenome]